jgi:hypothetical protein
MDVRTITVDDLVINAAAPSVVDYLALGRLYIRYGLINESGSVSFIEFMGTVSHMDQVDLDTVKNLSFKKSVVEGQKTPINDSTFASDPSALFAYMYEYMRANFTQLVNRVSS